MGSLINHEIQYHWRIYAGYFVLAPLLALLEAYPFTQNLPVRFWLVIVIFLMLQNRVTYRNKERRERLHALLPASYHQQALARFAVLIIPAILFVLWFSLWLKVLDRPAPLYLSQHLKSLGVIIVGFVAYYAIRDLSLYYFRSKGITKNNVVIGTMFLLLGLNILGIIAFIKATGGEAPDLTYIDAIVHFIIKSNPFPGTAGIYKFAVFCVLLGVINIATFHCRKAYLE